MDEMGDNQEKGKDRSGPVPEQGVRSKWSHVAAVSAILWMLLSLPLVMMALGFVAALGRQPDALISGTWSMDSILVVVITIVAPLPIISGITVITFLSARSARSRRIAAIFLCLSLLGMAMLVVMGMVSATEGRRTGGDMGMGQVIMSILVGVALPTLISIPGIFGLVSLWRLKGTIPEA